MRGFRDAGGKVTFRDVKRWRDVTEHLSDEIILEDGADELPDQIGGLSEAEALPDEIG